MNYLEFIQKVPLNIPFTTYQLSTFFPNNSLKSIRQSLFNWQKQNRIIKLRRNLYVISNEKIDIRLIANKIYEPSYISLEYALSFYDLIPDVSFQVTSVTTNKTNKFTNKLGNFFYRHLKRDFYFGFYYYENVLIAEKEKALLDYFYFNLKNIKMEKQYLRELRFQNMYQLNKRKIKRYLNRFNIKRLNYFVTFCLKFYEKDY